MKLKIYAIYDSKVEAFMQPFFMQSKGAAIRAFTDLANDPSTTVGKHPEDYTLFELSDWDDSSAKFDPLSTPQSIGVGVEFVRNT